MTLRRSPIFQKSNELGEVASPRSFGFLRGLPVPPVQSPRVYTIARMAHRKVARTRHGKAARASDQMSVNAYSRVR